MHVLYSKLRNEHAVENEADDPRDLESIVPRNNTTHGRAATSHDPSYSGTTVATDTLLMDANALTYRKDLYGILSRGRETNR